MKRKAKKSKKRSRSWKPATPSPYDLSIPMTACKMCGRQIPPCNCWL